jgi:large subunit ribosomal protein L4
MATANLYSQSGERTGTVDLPGALFEQPVHRQALYEAVRCYLANRRQGTADTRTRAEVTASGGKLYRQKGTGRARAGAASSPTRVGGGTAFGPHPRSYRQRLPRRIKRLALKSALSDRARHERVYVVEGISLESPRTGVMAQLMRAMELPGRHTLFVLPAQDEANVAYLSLRNLRGVRVLRSHELNAYAILWADNLVFTRDALSHAEEVFGA